MKLNWTVRLKNKTFWLTIVPAIALAIQAIVAILGIEINIGTTVDKLLTVINTVFSVLVIAGVVADPTTTGINDSNQALTYTKPKEVLKNE